MVLFEASVIFVGYVREKSESKVTPLRVSRYR